MTTNELKKYIGKHVSFDVDDLAYLPLPKITKEKDMRNNNHHFEGILTFQEGSPLCRSHFGLDVFWEEKNEYVSIGILDSDIPFIENFKIKEN